MKVLIAGIIWNKDGRIGARESLCARMAERELARMAEAGTLAGTVSEPVESEAA